MLNFLENKKGGKASLKETGYATGNIPAAARLGSAENLMDASPASIEAFSPSKARTNSLPDS